MPGLPPALLDLSLDLLAVFRPDGHFEQVNGRWTSVLGWEAHELVGHHFSEFVHPDDLPGTEAVTEHALSTGEPTQGYANRYRTKQGGHRWLLWESRELDDGRWLCAGRDITRERETVRELEALRRVATAVAGAGTAAEVFATVAQEVGSLVAGDEAGVVRRLADGRLEIAGAWSRSGEPTLPPGSVVDVRENPWLEKLFAGPVLRRELDPVDEGVPEFEGFGTSVTAPVTVGGTVWGLVAAIYASPRTSGPDAERRLAEFAALTAMAVANADAREQLERRALTDSLTGLMNHRAFHDRLAEEVTRARRHGRPLAVAILDVDHFKAVNDRYGHRTGDGVLRDLAAAIRADQRLGDAVGRIGGDEVAIALPDTDVAGALAAVERLRADVAGVDAGGGPVITLSAGVCGLRGDETGEDLMRRADELLYRSKRDGRDRTTAEPAPDVA